LEYPGLVSAEEEEVTHVWPSAGMVAENTQGLAEEQTESDVALPDSALSAEEVWA